MGKKIIAVVGPTGSGKSELALFLAEELRGEIVNTDSLQLYRGFDIGTAKTPPGERRGIPHHLLDIIGAGDPFSAGEYARRAREVLEEITARGAVPVLVGGTGFYLRALLEGLFPGPPADEELRDRLRRRSVTRRPGHLHRLLVRLDPGAAARIHANDTPKLIRALEVCLRARRPMSALFEESKGYGRLEGFDVRKVGLDPPRDALYERINRRTEIMFERGLVDEVRALLSDGVPPAAKPFESVGYKEALAVVESRMTLAQAIATAQARTRRYAKRQMTWFRRERDVAWINDFGETAAARSRALKLTTDKHR